MSHVRHITWEVNSAPNCSFSVDWLELEVGSDLRPRNELIFLVSGENYVSIHPLNNWCFNIGILSIINFDDFLLCVHTLSGL